MVAQLVPSCMMIHFEEIMLEKADKRGVYEKREGVWYVEILKEDV